MGFAEIQAALAANGAQPPATPAFTPSPFQPTTLAPPVVVEKAINTFLAATAPAQQAFTFIPPANAPTPPNGGPWSPINPPGERVALGQPISGPIVTSPFPAVAQASAPEAPAAEPPKRKRRTKAEMAAAQAEAPIEGVTVAELGDAARAVDLGAENQEAVSATMFDPSAAREISKLIDLDLKDLPADGSTVEDIVEELFARGVTQVNLTFAKYGRT